MNSMQELAALLSGDIGKKQPGNPQEDSKQNRAPNVNGFGTYTKINGGPGGSIDNPVYDERNLPNSSISAYGLMGIDATASGVDPKTTRKWSRMADAVNNRYYTKPADIGVRQAGATGVLANDRIGFGDRYQMKIETEEMRQQNQNRMLAQLKAQEQILRSGKLHGQALMQAQQKYNELLAQYRLSFNTDLQRRTTRWEQEFTHLELAEKKRLMIQSLPDAYSRGLLTQLFNVVDASPAQQLYYQAASKIMAQAAAEGWDETTTMLELGKLATAHSIANVQGVIMSAYQAIPAAVESAKETVNENKGTPRF